MESHIKILKLLLDNKEQQYTIKKIAESLKINYRIAYERVGLLEKENLLKITKAGNAKLCEFTNTFNTHVYEAEFYRRNDLFKRKKDFIVIRQRLAELNFVFVALVFGSHAKGKANKHSDIDILTIGGYEKEIQRTMSLLPDKIHVTTLKYEDFITMAKSKEFSVVSEAMKNNVILVGIEEYYRLLSNAR
ncbi:MAG: nucleotidyltransferase domain-containing protein [Nanoarchaeota archaeon]